MSPRKAKLINALRAAEGGFVSADELAETIWPDADGGPDDAPNAIAHMAHHLRKLGFPIYAQKSRGYRFVPTTAQII